MHYGDEYQEKNESLRIVVYKHGIAGKEPEYNAKGLLKDETVHYAITSIQECKLFSPRTLKDLLKFPYKHLNKFLSDKPFEIWMEVTLKEDEDGNIQMTGYEDVSMHPDDSKRLH